MYQLIISIKTELIFIYILLIFVLFCRADLRTVESTAGRSDEVQEGFDFLTQSKCM